MWTPSPEQHSDLCHIAMCDGGEESSLECLMKPAKKGASVSRLSRAFLLRFAVTSKQQRMSIYAAVIFFSSPFIWLTKMSSLDGSNGVMRK